MDAAFVALLARCYPFYQVHEENLTTLCDQGEVRLHNSGQPLLKRSETAGPLIYLVAGKAELRRSFFERITLAAGNEEVLQPLNQLLTGDGGQIVAASDECATLTIGRDLADQILASGADQGYGVATLHDSEGMDELLISDTAVDVDWMSRFLRSPLANQLPAVGIQQLLACLSSRDVVRGETVVRRGEQGDALYILTRGVASVKTDPQSVFGGREIGLMPGDHFGEEALVADTLRNATVVMESDGSVARLDRDSFNELVRPHLVRETPPSELADPDVIDVRFPVEHRRGAVAGSRNVPIPLVRAQLRELDPSRPILVTRDGGRRAELAVFLLRQAGFDAWLPRPD